MSRTLSDSTRLAIQATVAVSIATLISHLFQMQRAYWSILTAMLLISATWGESIKKAIERVGMTIIGGLVGTALYYWLPNTPHESFLVILLCAFFIIYFFAVSYLIAVFFITIFIVFLFAMLGQWNMSVLEARIIETIIGAVIATVVTLFVLPNRERHNMGQLINDYLTSMQTVVNHAFNNALKHTQDNMVHMDREKMVKGFFALQDKIKLISYEMVFTLYPRRKLKKVSIKLGLLMHYVTSLAEIAPNIHRTHSLSLIQPELQLVQQQLSDNFQSLQAAIAQTPSNHSIHDISLVCEALHTKIDQALADELQVPSCWHDVYSFIYFNLKINELLSELFNTLQD